MAHFSDKGKSNGKDYCIFFNSQWARLPQDLNKAVGHRWPLQAQVKRLPLNAGNLWFSVAPSDLRPDHVGPVLALRSPRGRLPKPHPHGAEGQLHLL